MEIPPITCMLKIVAHLSHHPNVRIVALMLGTLTLRITTRSLQIALFTVLVTNLLSNRPVTTVRGSFHSGADLKLPKRTMKIFTRFGPQDGLTSSSTNDYDSGNVHFTAEYSSQSVGC